MKAIWVAAAVGMLAAPSGADARVWTVGARAADFPLIGPAIAAATAGDVIEVRRGAYREDLLVDRTLTIVGEEGAVLFGTGAGTVITIKAPDCEIRGLTIDSTGTGAGNQMDAAIQITSNGNRIVGNHILRAFYGIVVAAASGNQVEQNTISGLSWEPFGRRGDGIYLYRAPGNRIIGNTITGMRDAIYLQYASGGVVERNVVEASRYGLHDMFSDGTRISGNTFRTCSAGANLMNSSGLLLEGNEFSGNRGVTAVGLALKECDRSDIRANRFASNGRGLQMDGSTGNRFEGNLFAQNDTAVRLLSSAECNVFVRNDFVGNWSDLVAAGRNTSTAWDAGGVGNRWSAYAGFDFDGDGIGDQPHPLVGPFEQIEGINPAARLFLQSPAAEALALAARLSAAESTLVDAHPIVRAGPPPRRASMWLGLFGIAAALMTIRR
jgi:nitrous oxidase accessory protein